MPGTWEEALQAYRYPVDLADFKDAGKYPGWFQRNDSPTKGTLAATVAFEKRFRELAPDHLEAWYEVVFWKMYSQRGRANDRTRRVIHRIRSSGVTADRLWSVCRNYTQAPSRRAFDLFRKKLVSSTVVAVAATFPAFIDSDDFPMVDTQIVKWARAHGPQHSYTQCGGPALTESPDLSRSVTTLRDDLRVHRAFVESWYTWCRFTADTLSRLSDRKWRARDVEMAVFTAQGNSRGLNPLCP